MILNTINAEELIFYNNKLRNKLSEFNHIFSQWDFAKQSPALRSLAKRTVLDFLNQLKKEHISLLEEYFNDKISLEKLNYNIVKNYDFPLEKANAELNDLGGSSNFCIYRKDDQLYISFWK